MKTNVKKVCKCENCGNESEMTFTCTLDDEQEKTAPAESVPPAPTPKAHHVKGTATCSHCGNEADMWIDI